jgi:gluconate 5-dehydrogenase
MGSKIHAFDLSGKRVLITGGGTGLGYGMAQAFVTAGAKVVISGRREATLQQACDHLGENSKYSVNDISDIKAIPEFVKTVENEFGQIDVLVNNAGKHLKKYASETTDAEFLDILQTNLLSVFALTREVADKMVRRKQGAIIMVSSMAAIMGIDRVVAYSVAKTGILGMMRTMVTEYSQHNIRINAIAPGWIDTPMLAQALADDEQRKARVLDRIPFDKFGDPEDIGNAAVFLAADAAKYITGVFLPVDGGASVSF